MERFILKDGSITDTEKNIKLELQERFPGSKKTVYKTLFKKNSKDDFETACLKMFQKYEKRMAIQEAANEQYKKALRWTFDKEGFFASTERDFGSRLYEGLITVGEKVDDSVICGNEWTDIYEFEGHKFQVRAPHYSSNGNAFGYGWVKRLDS